MKPRLHPLVAVALAAAAPLLTPPVAPPDTPPGQDPAPDLQSGPHRSGTYDVDSGHSTALFRIAHFGVSWFYGTFEELTGTLVVDPEDATKSSIELTIPVASVRSRAEGRDTHLKSAEFFAAEEHPELTFHSTAVKGLDGAGAVLEVTGELSLRGVTREVTIQVERVGSGPSLFGDHRTGYHTRFSVDRRDFGMDALPPPALGNEVQLTISLEAVRRT